MTQFDKMVKALINHNIPCDIQREQPWEYGCITVYRGADGEIEKDYYFENGALIEVKISK